MVQDGIRVGIYFHDQFVAIMEIYNVFGQWRFKSLMYGGRLVEPFKDKYSKIYNTYNFFEDGYVLLGNEEYMFIIKDNRIINFIAYESELGDIKFHEPKDFIDKKVEKYREIEANKGEIIMSSKNKPEDQIPEESKWKKWVDANK
jgi:hypothetical protein